jgi:hypothetical protein
LNENPAFCKDLSDNELPPQATHVSAFGQRSNGTPCHSVSLDDPFLVRLIEVWDTLPVNIKKAVEALCLPQTS